MASPLSVPHCNVDTGSTVHEGVSIRVPPGRNTATVHKGIDVREERPNVASVVALSGVRWQVTFEDGTTWDVTAQRAPCGCGH